MHTNGTAIKRRKRVKVSDVVIVCVVILFVLICLLPMLNVLALSLSSNSAILNSRVSFWPVETTLQAYRNIFRDKSMMNSLFFTIELTVIYTLLSMVLTVMCAYPLAKKRLKGRNFVMLLILFTMYFSGGMIPDYLLIQQLGILNTQWALILPQAISAFNMIILRTTFQDMPESLEEAAMLDGCRDLGILIRIYLPLSVPILATLSLFYAVGKWNSFQDALFYITRPNLYPLQLKLNAIITNSQHVEASIEGSLGAAANPLPESLKAACVMFASIPIILVYPWLQKYFVKGVMIGAIKG